MSLCRVIHATAFLCLLATAAFAESGGASWYGEGTGRPACGGKLGPMTAAHKTLPCNSRVRVTNKANGRSVIVTITDRGPYVKGRIIDLSPDAAKAIGMDGVSPVTVERE